MQHPSYLLCLEEVICNESMSRPLHHTERILDTVLRWGYWDDIDRKDNMLVLRRNDLFQQVAPLVKPPVMLCEEFKFADQKSKSFKSYQFQFSHAKLSYFKDKSVSALRFFYFPSPTLVLSLFFPCSVPWSLENGK